MLWLCCGYYGRPITSNDISDTLHCTFVKSIPQCGPLNYCTTNYKTSNIIYLFSLFCRNLGSLLLSLLPAAEYCAPVWSRSAHTSRVDVQLNSTMRLISGTLRSTPLPLLPVPSNIEPPALRRKTATDKLVEKIVKHDRFGQSSLISLAHHCYD